LTEVKTLVGEGSHDMPVTQGVGPVMALGIAAA
jgi:hypothetical protein